MSFILKLLLSISLIPIALVMGLFIFLGVVGIVIAWPFVGESTRSTVQKNTNDTKSTIIEEEYIEEEDADE